jgi:hypothetical protein
MIDGGEGKNFIVYFASSLSSSQDWILQEMKELPEKVNKETFSHFFFAEFETMGTKRKKDEDLFSKVCFVKT